MNHVQSIRHFPARLSSVRRGWQGIVFSAALAALVGSPDSAPAAPPRPNIIFILADDLGWGDVGFNGQTMIQTPRLDQMRAEGVNFTQAYAGSAVCAPSRYCQLTGLHTGHATVFDFTSGASGANWRIEDAQVQQLLHGAGYSTWFAGKWGFGASDANERDPAFSDSTDVPLASELDFFPQRMGWDASLAFLNHATAHFYFPDFLWRDGVRTPLPGNYHQAYGNFPATGTRADYAQDLFHQEIVSRIQSADGSRPFYAQCSYLLPHRETIAPPGFNPYAATGWPVREQAYAALVTYLDQQVGQIIDAVEANPALRDNTLIIFTGDNGPQFTDGRAANFTGDSSFFNSNGPFKANKFNLYEGGIRVPFIARWKGRIASNTTRDDLIAFWDFLPTICELAGVKAPSGLDGVSYAGLLIGTGPLPARDHLYFRLIDSVPGPGLTTSIARAVRRGDWKLCIPQGKTFTDAELYNLATDPGETTNLIPSAATTASLLSTILTAEETGPLPVVPGQATLIGAPIALPTPDPGPAQPAVTSETVALWRFDESGRVAGQMASTLTDATGLHVAAGNGNIVGSQQYPRLACDLFNALVPRSRAANQLALSFQAALGQYLQVPAASDLNVTGAPFTIEAWVRLHRLAASLTPADRQWVCLKKVIGDPDAKLDFSVLAQMGDFATLPGAGKKINNTGREVGLVFGTGSDYFVVTSQLELTDYEWHFLAAAVDLDSGKIRFTLDGRNEELTFPTPRLAGANAGPLILAAHPNPSGVFNQFMDGLLDEVRLSRGYLPPADLLNAPSSLLAPREWEIDFGNVQRDSPAQTRTFQVANAATAYANLLEGTVPNSGITDPRLSLTSGTFTGLADGARSTSFSLTLQPTANGVIDQATTLTVRNVGHGSIAVHGVHILRIRGRVVDPVPVTLSTFELSRNQVPTTQVGSTRHPLQRADRKVARLMDSVRR